MLPLSVSALSALGASLCLLPCLSRTSITCHKRWNFNIKYEHFISKDMIGRAAKASEASLHGVDILDSFLMCCVERVSLFNRTRNPNKILHLYNTCKKVETTIPSSHYPQTLASHSLGCEFFVDFQGIPT